MFRVSRVCYYYAGRQRCVSKMGPDVTRVPNACDVRVLGWEAESEGLVFPSSRTRTKSGPIFAATRRDGVNFPNFFVPRRSRTTSMRHSSLLELEKITPVAAVRVV